MRGRAALQGCLSGLGGHQWRRMSLASRDSGPNPQLVCSFPDTSPLSGLTAGFPPGRQGPWPLLVKDLGCTGTLTVGQGLDNAAGRAVSGRRPARGGSGPPGGTLGGRLPTTPSLTCAREGARGAQQLGDTPSPSVPRGPEDSQTGQSPREDSTGTEGTLHRPGRQGSAREGRPGLPPGGLRSGTPSGGGQPAPAWL